MTRAGILISKEPVQQGIYQGSEHPYVACVIADPADSARQFMCRVLDIEEIPVAVGEHITLEVLHVVTDRKNGKIRFDCKLV